MAKFREERACSDSIYLFLLRQKDVNLLWLKMVILLKNTNYPNLLRPTFLKSYSTFKLFHFWTLDILWLVNNRFFHIIWIRMICLQSDSDWSTIDLSEERVCLLSNYSSFFISWLENVNCLWGEVSSSKVNDLSRIAYFIQVIVESLFWDTMTGPPECMRTWGLVLTMFSGL